MMNWRLSKNPAGTFATSGKSAARKYVEQIRDEAAMLGDRNQGTFSMGSRGASNLGSSEITLDGEKLEPELDRLQHQVC